MRAFRTEWKFLVHHRVKAHLLARWSPYLMPGAFTDDQARSTILSQYYDSPELVFYEEKLNGIGLRNKVRLRVYGTCYAAGSTAFLEIKHRLHDRIRKYRVRIPDFTPDHLDPGMWRFDDPVMQSAFLTLLERHSLRPSAQVSYQREAYEGVMERDVRITFDSHLLALHPGETMSPEISHASSRLMMADTLSILEVKATRDIPPWVHAGIVDFELQQRTIPKYITSVETLGLNTLHPGGAYA